MSVALLRTVHPFYQQADTLKITAFLFTATLGVYTLHRLISFRRAQVIPTTKRYALVANSPFLCLCIGLVSLGIAAIIILPHLPKLWLPFSVALLLTGFYLIPPLPGWRRLRDIPYLKVVWVAAAWALMTHMVPWIMAHQSGYYSSGTDFATISILVGRELTVRFLFTLTVALLFDGRDIQLDLANGVKTVANTYPNFLRWATIGSLVICGSLSLTFSRGCIVPDAVAVAVSISYLICIPIAYHTFSKKAEDWYAVAVNGLLLIPPLMVALALWLSL